ncbi:mcfdp2, putative [Pediculus humanus corporis]|uniref:Mcfdp2, putative n=1 Tax=Pediculus humanus subsp. corporis TaxID=121224 RepID=E0VTQ2_PEDHC|nr:mcfdp2, putative [Pediculus humanus corporis]EEB16758.1 mcfdp2, putative [Pediculus humanus corporis]
MKNIVTFSVVVFEVIVLVTSQRVAPGVPPQHYQQPPPQQYQQVPQQQQAYYQPQVPQQPPQHVPVPQQPMQPIQQPIQQPTYQQVPVPQQPAAVHPSHPQAGHPQQILHASNIALEKEHIQEHLDVPVDTSKMTEQELQFHYFKMHDADNNNKLDGCELIKSLIHWHEQGHKDPHGQVPTGPDKLFKDEELISLIDPILAMDDTNKDGYIDYPEFIKAQQKAAAKAD